ncbi:hypothetical protein [Prosthecobacter sp.]|jgi:hypothetical protein|uniref:hypothetical protein n=1 Tax=Prosthecobacter sp. TaxID=1965333 RepID=UPI0037830782
MKCPRCQGHVTVQQNTCNACGFSATLLHGYLGNQWVKLERITDAAHCLRLEEARRAEVVLDEFERSFPQAFFATYLGVLPNYFNVSELGFWLLNQGAFNTPSVSRRNDFGVVLVVDPSSLFASLTLGYAVEAYFGEDRMQQILQSVAKLLAEGAHGEAIVTACTRCAEVLRKHGTRTAWSPASLGGGSQPDMGLQPLRGGQKQSSRPLAGFPHS